MLLIKNIQMNHNAIYNTKLVFKHNRHFDLMQHKNTGDVLYIVNPVVYSVVIFIPII